jgi:hypothetical protein
MSQHVRADALYVLWSDVTAAVEKRVGPSAERKINRRTWRSSVSNKSFESQIVGCGLARGPDDVHNVVLYAIIDVNAVDHTACGDDLPGVNHWINSQIRRRSRHQVENVSLLRLLRITNVQFEHETVELCFRQLISSFLFNRVLGC